MRKLWSLNATASVLIVAACLAVTSCGGAPGSETLPKKGAKTPSPDEIQDTVDDYAGETKPKPTPKPTATPAPVEGILNPAASLVATQQAEVMAGQETRVVVRTFDTTGKAMTQGGAEVLVSLSDEGSSTGLLSEVVDAHDGTYFAQFSGLIAGTPRRLDVRVNNVLLASGLLVQVVPGVADAAHSLVLLSSSQITSGMSVDLLLEARDAFDNRLARGGDQVAFAFGGGVATAVIGTVSDLQSGGYQAALTGKRAGTDSVLSATLNGSSVTTTMPPLAVLPGVADPCCSLVTASASSVLSGEQVRVVLEGIDVGGNSVALNPDDVVFAFEGGTSTGTFSQTGVDAEGRVYADWTGVRAGTATGMKASLRGEWVATPLPFVVVTPGQIASLALETSSANMTAGESRTVRLVARDSAGNATSQYAGTVHWSSQDPRASLPGDHTFVPVDNGEIQERVTLFTEGRHAISVQDIALPALSASASIMVRSAAPSKMTWNGDLEAPAGICSPVTTLSLWDAFDNAAILSTSATLTLEASGDARFFDDAACGNAVSGLDLAAGASTANVYVLSPSVGTQTLTAAIGGIGVTNRSFTWRASLAWSGVSATVGLTESSGIAVRGRMDGQLNGPYHAAFDLSEHLYVSDTANNRIVKYSISSGSFEGWVGRVLSTPSGGTNVNCALAGNTTTPGWCTGGQPSTNSTSDLSWDGMYKAPQGVAVVGDFLYAVDSGNNRVVRLVAATGEFAGWIGQIGTYDATGGAAGCETAITGSVTPGWCFGGTSALGTQGGALSSPRDIESDGTWLYVSDMNNHRLSRYALATGAFAGWFGAVASTPTGGASGCASAAVNTVTPGWCLGGTSKTLSTLDGAFNKPQGLAVQDGKLFVADSANYRVQRLFLGADERVTSGGWIGKVGTTKPTGGVAGCTTVTNAQTPGWCLGGTPTSSGVTAEGNLSLPADVAVAGAFLFAADFGNGRVNRYDLESGAKAGWTGRIVSKPTGGEAGCTTAAVGAATPGWCTGGTPQLGVLLGSFYSPTGLVVDSRGLNLWTIDNALHRLVAIDVATGRSASWLGGKPEIPSAWSVVSPVPGAFGTFQSEGLNPGSSTDLFLSGTTLLMADMGNHRLRRMELSAPAAVDWIGNVFHTPTGGDTSCLTAPLNFGTPVWCRGGITRSGAGNNMFVNPQGVWSDGTYAYVADTGNHRIVRISLATGGFAGWIGRISTKPTGGASGCSTASLSATTPGWCLGGTAKSGVDDGQFNTPYGIVGGAGSLYVADTNNRITRIQAASGVMTGWVGRVLTVPTGGATGCASTAVGAATPGWCLGGTAQAGSSDGQFYGPRSLTLADGNLYVSDYSNNRIQRLSLLSGLMTGWVGYISTRPTGGMTGCTTATGKTPGWCTGGSARTGSVDGAYAGPRGITSDGTWLFIADSNNHRLARLDLATGAWQGWKGLIGNSRPTGGDTGCATAATGTVTPGWCVGGSPARGWTLGAFDTPVGLGNDGQNYLYVADTNNGRLVRVPK